MILYLFIALGSSKSVIVSSYSQKKRNTMVERWKKLGFIEDVDFCTRELEVPLKGKTGK